MMEHMSGMGMYERNKVGEVSDICVVNQSKLKQDRSWDWLDSDIVALGALILCSDA